MEERLAYIATLCDYSKSNRASILKKEARCFVEYFLDQFATDGGKYEYEPTDEVQTTLEFYFNHPNYLLTQGTSRTHFRHFTFNIKHSHVKLNASLPFYANMVLIVRYFFELTKEEEDVIFRQCFKAFFKKMNYPLVKKLKFFYVPF